MYAPDSQMTQKIYKHTKQMWQNVSYFVGKSYTKAFRIILTTLLVYSKIKTNSTEPDSQVLNTHPLTMSLGRLLKSLHLLRVIRA